MTYLEGNFIIIKQKNPQASAWGFFYSFLEMYYACSLFAGASAEG